MGSNTWKVIGIISLVINALFISIFFVGLNFANESIENDNICYYDVCDVDNIDAPAYDYYYDELEKVCYCFNEYDEIIQETYLI